MLSARTTLVLLLIFGPLFGQRLVPPLPEAFKEPASEGRSKTALLTARRLVAEGRGGDAARHFTEVLSEHPFAATLWREWLPLAPESSRSLLVHRLLQVSGDVKSKAVLDAATRKMIPDLGVRAEKLAQARLDAIDEVMTWASKLRPAVASAPGEALHLLFAEDIVAELLRGAPRATEKAALVFNAASERLVPTSEAVLSVLDSWLSKAVAKGETGEIVEIARRILGLAAQARFHDLMGPKPAPFKAIADRASEALGRARAEIRAKAGEPLTVEALTAMGQEEREAYSKAHATPANPGFAISPRGWYVVETAAGHATLLGVAATIELHHERLSRWYGVDPFTKEQGYVRIVPEAHELESEGTPYWWAGGFQSGPVTQMIFHTGTIEGLGHGLTHELTHRFDGALYAGLPAWAAEGRAVWTGSAYGVAANERFAPNHVSFGTVEQAFIKGYGDPNRLQKLISGTIEDYRDNYTAGYALYAYLKLWAEPEDRPLFASNLEKYLKGIYKGRSRPVEWFAHHFADGKEGRPADIEKFAEGFGKFLRGFYWDSRAPWTARYVVKFEGSADGYVYDAPTWTKARQRAEPFFGQDHLSAAMRLGERRGESQGVVLVGLKALMMDEMSAEDTDRLREALIKTGQGEAAAMLHAWRRARGGSAPTSTEISVKRWPKLQALMALLRESAATLGGRNDAALRAVLAAEHDGLATLLGAPLCDRVEVDPENAPLIDPPPFALTTYGLEEDDLVGYQERRVRNLWYEDTDNDLHVGREKPREGTGAMDRQAHQRDAFVRSKLWNMPGRYVFRSRVHLTTSFVSGSLVLGYTRRDRFVRLNFSAGDWLYAIGKKDEQTHIKSVSVNFHGSRVRDQHLHGAEPGKQIKFSSPKTSFEVQLLVDHGMVQAWVEGEFVGTYHSMDGADLEGYLGFAAGQGAYRLERPTVQREDRSAALGLSARGTRGFRFDEKGKTTWSDIRNHRVLDLVPTPGGRVVLLIPMEFLADAWDPKSSGLVTDLLKKLLSRLESKGLRPPVAILVPESVDPEFESSLKISLKDILEFSITIHRHALSFEKDAAIPGLLYIDPVGILRHVSNFEAYVTDLDSSLDHILRVHRP